METPDTVTNVDSKGLFSMSWEGDSASPAESETGTRRKKHKRYRLKKTLGSEQVSKMCQILGLQLEDFEEIKAKKKKPDDQPREPANAAFFVFWKLYPRHDIIGAAMREWKTLSPDGDTLEMILSDVKKRLESWDWKKDQGKWIPFAHTYLRDQRWLDKGVVNNEIIKRRTVV